MSLRGNMGARLSPRWSARALEPLIDGVVHAAPVPPRFAWKGNDFFEGEVQGLGPWWGAGQRPGLAF